MTDRSARTEMVDATSVKVNGEVSFWYADIGGVPDYRAPLPGDLQVDVCIVGAGYTGLWTAYYLKTLSPDLSIAIVEKEFAGFGASGRNGGWCSGEFGWSRERYGASSTPEHVIEFERQLRACVAEIERVTHHEGIDCDFLNTDCMVYACTPSQWQRLRDEHSEAMSWQVPDDRLSLIDGPEAARRINVPNVCGALVRHHVARVQPAKLVRGIARAVENMGVSIHEQTAAANIEEGRVTTDRGVVTASHIVRATEGFTTTMPNVAREWLPLNSAMLVTEPVPDKLWQAIGWDGRELLGDASHAYCYAQRTCENRIAIGGRGTPYRYGSALDVRGRTQHETVKQLTEILYRMLPQTRGLQLDHAWCGVLGVPRDWCATVGMDRKTGLAWAGGYVGLGVSTSNLAGQTLADLILDRQTSLTELSWVNRRPRKWEPEPLRWMGVHGLYRLYRMADRQEFAKNSAETSIFARAANFIQR